MSSTVWVVFKAFNFGGDPVFVALEIDQTIVLLMTTTTMTDCDVAVVLRPEPRIFFSSKDATGAPLCKLGVTTLSMPRRPGEVGLVFKSAI